jgi:hypothetical protein
MIPPSPERSMAVPPPPPATPRPSWATALAFVGLLAVAGGWFLPWVADAHVHGGAGFAHADLVQLARLEREAGRDATSDDVVRAARRLLRGEAVDGFDLGALARYVVDPPSGARGVRGPDDPVERRAFAVAGVVLRIGPYVAAAVALLLLLGRLRKPAFVVLGLVLAVALLLGGGAALLLLGASLDARETVANDPTALGLGVYTIALGGLATLVGGLGAARLATWWKAYLVAIVAVVAAIAGAAAYVHPT